MKTATPHSRGRLTTSIPAIFAALLVIISTPGCQKKSGSPLPVGLKPMDPQVVENLAKLTYELRRATPRHNITNFDGFLAVSQAEVPPPPPGQKYAIGQGWRIVLVDASAK